MSEDVLEAARNHTRDFTKFDRAFQEYHLAEAHLIAALAAEVRELRRDKERLDWILNDDFARYDPYSKRYWYGLEARSEIDAMMQMEEEARTR